MLEHLREIAPRASLEPQGHAVSPTVSEVSGRFELWRARCLQGSQAGRVVGEAAGTIPGREP
jgi:hypothetical protein